MVRCTTFAWATAITLLLAANSLAHYAPTSSPQKSDVVVLAAHFDRVPGVCTVELGSAGVPTDKLGWLGDPDTVMHRPSVPLRTALAAHGRLYRPRQYRTDAVYFAQPAWSSGAVIDREVDLRSLDMFVQVVTAREADCRFKFHLMFDLDANDPPAANDLIAFVEVDVEDSSVAPSRLPYGVGLNPALPASFGAIQHAMAAVKTGFAQSTDGIGGSFGGLASAMWTPAAAASGDALGGSLFERNYDLQGNANQEAPTGWESTQHAPEPSSLAVFGGLGLLALCSTAMRKRERKWA